MKTAGAAEAWALVLTLRENPFPPRILTDCMGLLTAARAGPTTATKGNKIDARIWKLISAITDNNFAQLSKTLVWMPAHTTSSAAGTRAKSDGKLLTTAEWRANDLADKLAKKGAACTPLRVQADATISLAGEALLQSAAKLGVVTHAANCHATEVTLASGATAVHMSRDSTAMPAQLARIKASKALEKAAEAAKAGPKAPPAPRPLAKPLPATSAAQRKAQATKALAASAAATRASQVATLVIEAAATANPPAITAASRMASLRARLGLQQHEPQPAASAPRTGSASAAACAALEAPVAAASSAGPAQAESWTFLEERPS